MPSKTKTYVIPTDIQTKYIVTVYGVEKAPKLPIGLFTWNYDIRVPSNGIVLTSTNYNQDFTQTLVKTTSGNYFNSDSTKWGFVNFVDKEIECQGQSHKYSSIYIDSISCCGYSTDDIDTFEIGLHESICEQMPSW
jgi:hypothetical protein